MSQRESKPANSIAIVVHDVAPATWPECEQLIQLVEALCPGCPLTLLMVPDFHHRGAMDRADSRWRILIDRRVQRGDELALHGYWHLDGPAASASPRQWLARRLLTAGEGEFAALSHSEARARIERGLDVFRRLGWNAQGFVAPAWQMSEGCRKVLSDFPFDYTSDLRALYSLPQWYRYRAMSLSFSSRAAWRRALSPHWNRAVLNQMRQASLLRVALHPADARYPQLLSAWRNLLAAALRERTPVTKHDWVSRQVQSAPLLAV